MMMMIPRRDNVVKNKYKDYFNYQDKYVIYDNDKYIPLPFNINKFVHTN